MTTPASTATPPTRIDAVLQWLHEHLLKPFADYLTPESEWFLPYLLLTIGIVYAVYRLRDNKQHAGFWRYCFPPEVYLHSSSRMDLKYFFVNTIVHRLLIVPVLFSGFALGDWLSSAAAQPAMAGTMPWLTSSSGKILVIALLIFAYDFGYYVAHWLLHRIPPLWELHKIHHSAEVLNPLTLYRQHPLEKLFHMTLATLCLALLLGVLQLLAGKQLTLDTFFWVFGILFFLSGGHLRHMHVWISYGKWFNHVFISPAHHQLHHSIASEHLDKNFGGIFSLWDWLFGTMALPERPQQLTLGLRNNEHAEYNSLSRFYFRPFRNWFRK